MIYENTENYLAAGQITFCNVSQKKKLVRTPQSFSKSRLYVPNLVFSLIHNSLDNDFRIQFANDAEEAYRTSPDSRALKNNLAPPGQSRGRRWSLHTLMAFRKFSLYRSKLDEDWSLVTSLAASVVALPLVLLDAPVPMSVVTTVAGVSLLAAVGVWYQRCSSLPFRGCRSAVSDGRLRLKKPHCKSRKDI
ncbi:hypothetical protein EVAR_17297_1 [Eumeta japonica]|uniref:Uncharacterized protein n=1 Tax=Eumeta variegata TaxID=151549 RepID=A0A4C1TTN9_EUMVA|nr:hypothetical protein EVAR_17297_1 [Eumeta japonica]